MKTLKFEPFWVLLVGCLVAPLACALNAALLQIWIGGSPLKTGEWQTIGIVASFVTGPQGGATYGILSLWRQEKYRAARGVALFCALFSLLFWLWVWHGLELKMQWGHRGSVPVFGALVLPVLWSFLFGVFAFVARSRKI